MKFDGIDGESTNAQHKDWSDVLQTSLSVTVPVSTSGGGRRRGAAVVSDLNWTQDIDASYPSLFSRITRGENTSDVDIDYTFVPRDGEREQVYFSMHFENVSLTRLDLGIESSSRGQVNGAFYFQDLLLTYFEYADGRLVGQRSAAYSAETGEIAAAFADVLLLGSSAPSTVPLPGAAWLCGSALILLGGTLKRRQRGVRSNQASST